MTIKHYITSRYAAMRRGWGRPWVRWLWLDAVLYGTARWLTLYSPLFRRWCYLVDQEFFSHHDWPRRYTADTGLDAWIDAYWRGESPQDAAYEETLHWEG